MLFHSALMGVAFMLTAQSTTPEVVRLEASVALRDRGGTKVGELVREGADGVEIEVKDGAGAHRQLLRWDQIRALTADGASAERAQRLALGALLWRGRTRLAHGDLEGARRMFTQAGGAAEDSGVLERMMIDEGLARTASVDQDRWAESLAASLNAASLRARFDVPREWLANPSAFDAASGLILEVAPVWFDGASAKRARESLVAAADRARAQSDLSGAQLCTLCARIAAADAGEPEKAPSRVTAPTQLSPSETQQPSEVALEPSSLAARAAAKLGLRLLTGWADAVAADAPARKRGRETLHSIARAENGRARLWAIYGEGRSLVMEDDPDKVRLGVGKMLLIPAAYGAESPRLAEAALVQSAIALARIHDDESAALLRAMPRESNESPRVEDHSNPGALP